jgi:hypothetical protein
MIKTAALVFRIVFLLIGILGFVPGVAPDEMLLGIFHVNVAHNAVHIASGIIGWRRSIQGLVPNFRNRLCDRRYLGLRCREWQYSLGGREQSCRQLGFMLCWR